jgi:hypothetical protein
LLLKKSIKRLLCFAAAVTISTSVYATDPMDWAIDNGIIVGMENNEADPDGIVTRAQLATIITRFCDPKELDYTYTYSDVHETDWYYPYVKTISSSGIMIGDSGLWRPEDNVTYEEAVTTLIRALGCELQNTGGKEVLDTVSEWATVYINTAINYGIVDDTSNIDPKHFISRYELSELIYNSHMSGYYNKENVMPIIDEDGTVWTPIFVN